jgi:drug/metabolite transporter (DMT)-like permease
MRTAILTLTALVAFAANSILCRLALRGATIDAASFTSLRLVSGAVALALIQLARGGGFAGNWISAAALFLYAAPFSFAYLSLSAGTGALILFGAVQATMISAGLRDGERPHRLEWTGLLTALGGLVYLVLPGLVAPPLLGSVLMACAGVSWGIYSLRGRGVARPIAVTAGNFLRTVPIALLVNVALARNVHLSGRGALLAVTSGAVTSGVGYVIWYAAIRNITATHAASVQLSVPLLTALGGVLFLGEILTTRLILSTVLILGGVAVALRGRLRTSLTVASHTPADGLAPDP